MLIRGHDLQTHTVEEFDLLKEKYGIDGYQLAIKKSFPIASEQLTFEDLTDIDESVFVNTKILGAYFNPVHPDRHEVEVGIENFIFNMHLAVKHGIKFVASETGSKMGVPWDYHPDNHKQETIDESIAAFKEISERTQGLDVKIAIEPAFHHVIKDLKSLDYLYTEVNDDRLVYIIDLFNLLNVRPYEDYMSLLKEILTVAQDKIAIIHLKDFVIEENHVKEVKIGDGIVDFAALISLVKEYIAEPLFVLEGTLEEHLPHAMQVVSKKN